MSSFQLYIQKELANCIKKAEKKEIALLTLTQKRESTRVVEISRTPSPTKLWQSMVRITGKLQPHDLPPATLKISDSSKKERKRKSTFFQTLIKHQRNLNQAQKPQPATKITLIKRNPINRQQGKHHRTIVSINKDLLSVDELLPIGLTHRESSVSESYLQAKMGSKRRSTTSCSIRQSRI